MAKENFKELEQDIVDFFNDRFTSTFSAPLSLNFYFQSNIKQKGLIKLTKIPDHFSVIMNKDILVQVNEEYFDAFDDEINIILFDQAIAQIDCDLDKGTFKIGKANFNASEGIITKYTYDRVQKALELERLYEDQKKDQNNQ